MNYLNTLRPKGCEWSYLIPLASVTTGCGPVVYWIVVLAAYYLAPFCAWNEMDFMMDFMKKLMFCPDILGEMSRILVQGYLIGAYYDKKYIQCFEEEVSTIKHIFSVSKKRYLLPQIKLILDISFLDCDVLNAPLRGSVEFAGTTYGNVATYSCDENYEISGVLTRQCLSDGQWSAAKPGCALRGKYNIGNISLVTRKPGLRRSTKV